MQDIVILEGTICLFL